MAAYFVIITCFSWFAEQLSATGRKDIRPISDATRAATIVVFMLFGFRLVVKISLTCGMLHCYTMHTHTDIASTLPGKTARFYSLDAAVCMRAKVCSPAIHAVRKAWHSQS